MPVGHSKSIVCTASAADLHVHSGRRGGGTRVFAWQAEVIRSVCGPGRHAHLPSAAAVGSSRAAIAGQPRWAATTMLWRAALAATGARAAAWAAACPARELAAATGEGEAAAALAACCSCWWCSTSPMLRSRASVLTIWAPLWVLAAQSSCWSSATAGPLSRASSGRLPLSSAPRCRRACGQRSEHELNVKF